MAATQPWALQPGAPFAIPALPAAATADAGGQAVLSAAFRSHYAPLCRLAYVIVGDSAAAEDIVAEAFVRTFAGWRRVREPDRVALYLRRAVVNLSRTRLRSRGSEARAASRLAAAPTPPAPDGDSSRAEVLDAVRRLPDGQRAAVVLFYLLDLPEAEVAEILGTSVGTVKSQLWKARRTLGKLLEEHAGG